MNPYTFKKSGFWRLCFIFSFVLFLSACVDLSGAGKYTPAKPAVKSNKNLKKSAMKVGEVHTMLGGLGIFSKGMYKLRNSVANRYDIPADSIMWYNAGDLTRSIEKNYYAQVTHRPIILIGHSLGANEQIKVARNLNKDGIPVDLLVTVDAVSQTIVPPNVKEALNMYKPGFIPMFSGLKLRAVNPQATHIENVNVATLKDVQVNHFTIDKDDVVQDIILAKIKQVLSNANS